MLTVCGAAFSLAGSREPESGACGRYGEAALDPRLAAAGFRGQMRDRGRPGFAIGIVELAHAHALDRRWIETTHIDVDTVGVRTRNVEDLDAADLAEPVFGDTGIERVLGQVFGALQQAKARGRHDKVQEPGHAANRTIALDRLDACRRVDFDAHAAAMAGATVRDIAAHADGRT